MNQHTPHAAISLIVEGTTVETTVSPKGSRNPERAAFRASERLSLIASELILQGSIVTVTETEGLYTRVDLFEGGKEITYLAQVAMPKA